MTIKDAVNQAEEQFRKEFPTRSSDAEINAFRLGFIEGVYYERLKGEDK